MTKSEPEILYMTVTNSITRPCLPFMNGVLTGFSQLSHPVLTHPIHFLSNNNLAHAWYLSDT